MEEQSEAEETGGAQGENGSESGRDREVLSTKERKRESAVSTEEEAEEMKREAKGKQSRRMKFRETGTEWKAGKGVSLKGKKPEGKAAGAAGMP